MKLVTRFAAITTTTLAVVAVGLPANAATSPRLAAVPTPTAYALVADGHGLTVKGGLIPVNVSRVGYAGIGCTSKAGLDKTKSVAQVQLGSYGSVDGIKTDLHTAQTGATVSSSSVSDVAGISLGFSALGTLTIGGIETTAKSWHNGSGYHATATTTVASIKLKPVIGPAQSFDLPGQGQTLTIPGVATIKLGTVVQRTTAKSAYADSEGLIIKLLPTSSELKVGHARTRVDAATLNGVFGGKASAVQVSVLGNLASTAPIPNTTVPCQGTGGVDKVASVPSATLGPLSLGTLTTTVNADSQGSTIGGYALGEVGKVTLAGLEIDGIVGKVNLSKTGKKVTANTNGTTVGSITYNGQTVSIPTNGTYEIPGLVRLELGPSVKKGASISVSALKLTLLGGTGATILLGNASMSIRK